MSRRNAVLTVSSLALAVGFGYGIRAFAGGIPKSSVMSYSGTLTNTTGAPVTGTHHIQVSLFDAPTGGNLLCRAPSAPVVVSSGQFSVPLPDGTTGCTSAVGAHADTWVEVDVDGNSTGRTKVGAVPYAVEANHASRADNATGAITPTSVSVGDAAVINGQGQWVGPPIVQYFAATQTVTLTVATPTWSNVLAAPITFTLPNPATAEVLAAGSVSAATGIVNFYCGIRLVVDGAAQGDSSWGNVIAGGANDQWTPWTINQSFLLAAGQHSVSLQMNSDNSTSCQSVAAGYSAATVRVMAFNPSPG